jgi:hypothetical protein
MVIILIINTLLMMFCDVKKTEASCTDLCFVVLCAVDFIFAAVP